MKTIIKIESEDKESIELFFKLLDKSIAAKESDPESFEVNGIHVSIFQLDFKALHKIVTNKKKKSNVTKKTKPKKQDNKKNAALTGIVGLYASSGLSMSAIAAKMNKEGYKNSRGNDFNKQQVFRLLKKYRQEESLLLNRE